MTDFKEARRVSEREPLVVVYDPIHTFPWTYEVEEVALAAHGARLALPETLDEARALLPEADVVVVSVRLPEADLRLAERCCGILCYSVGKDGVDAAVAAELGIPVTNVPDYCTEEVSDHAVALLLALQRLVVPFAIEGAAGRWEVRDWPEFMTMRRLRGQVVGVAGVGRIGTRVAEKVRGLGMTAIGYDPFLTEPPLDGMRLVSFEELLAESDAVVTCAALTDGSRGLFDAGAFATMRPGSVFVNVARGGLVDEAALADALRSGHLRGAALDVRATEPTDPATDPLLGLRNVVLTQHVAATSVEAFADMHRLAAERIVALLAAGGRVATSEPPLALL
jgi:D-3-phosphoglycerate dehydrogenase